MAIFNQIGGGTAKYKVLVGTVDTPTTYPSAYSVSISDTSIKATDTAILPYNFSNGGAVCLNDEIHILGSAGTTGTAMTSHYKWDGSTWTKLSTLSYNFSDGSAVVLNGEIHILGSYINSNYTKHYKWDGSSWTEVSTLPYNFYYGSAVVLNDNIHILGGNDDYIYNHYSYTDTYIKA